jgi:cytochrome b6-f complex iron-sulfur subunit
MGIRAIDERPKTLPRRRFVKVAFLGGLGVLAAGSAAAALRFVYRRDDQGRPRTYHIRPEDAPAAGTLDAFEDAGFKFFVVALPDRYVALARRCPHEACMVPWLPQFTAGGHGPGLFRCPCCGSTFDRDGSVVEGPATRGLDRLPVTVARDGALRIELPPRAAPQT